MHNKINKFDLTARLFMFVNLTVRRLVVLLVILVPVSAGAGDVLSAKDAFTLASREKIILVDIRSESEWKETGIASIAKTLSMHDRQFLLKFQAIIHEADGRPIALICATGGRSAWLKKELSSRGIKNILDVKEGMLGSAAGPGWLRAKLPIVPYTETSESPGSDEHTFWERITGLYKPFWLTNK